MITIEGERTQQKEDKNEKMHRVESFYGHFTRSFSLPESVDENAIRCDSKDGVLTVHIPKAASAKQQRGRSPHPAREPLCRDINGAFNSPGTEIGALPKADARPDACQPEVCHRYHRPEAPPPPKPPPPPRKP